MSVHNTSQSAPIIIVEVDPILLTSAGVESNNEDLSIWNNCICSEFPIVNKTIIKRQALCEIGFPHLGYTLKASVKDGLLNGNATIEDSNGTIVARLNYEKGMENGKCTLYYKSGKVYFQGYLQNGYRSGIGKEFSEKGEVNYYGFYKNGCRDYHTVRRSDRSEYWNEFDNFGQLISVCIKDNLGRNNGVCYFYWNGNISYISRWCNGEEKEILHKFEGDIMTSYEKGQVVYEGKYFQRSDFEFCPHIPVEAVQYDIESNTEREEKRKEQKKNVKKKQKVQKPAYIQEEEERCFKDWKISEYSCIVILLIFFCILIGVTHDLWESLMVCIFLLIIFNVFVFILFLFLECTLYCTYNI